MKKGTIRGSYGGVLIFIVTLFVIVGMLIGKSAFLGRLTNEQTAEQNEYSRHYAFITGNADDLFWNQVYQSAKEQAELEDAYVEWFGKKLSGNYSVSNLTRMAMQAGVDGIILQASEEPDVKDAINDAVAAGIPVVTVLSDCEESSRQAYVGVNSYDIGLLYGEKLVNLIRNQFRKNIRIMVAAEGDVLTDSQERIILGMRQYLKDKLPVGYYVDINPQLISQGAAYATEEFFNDMFVSAERLPAVLICLDERGTKCSYRASVDHNRVGETVIIGYYYSKDILSALDKQTLDSVLYVDAEEMGNSAVDALVDFQNFGYMNSYKIVSVKMMGHEEAAEMIRKNKEEAGEEVE